MATLYMLIGIPGSGKSTWAANQSWIDTVAYISSDKFVDEYATTTNRTYSEVWDEYKGVAESRLQFELDAAICENRDILWDQTNVSATARKRKLSKLQNYKKIAVVFPTPSDDELSIRLASRPGKNISESVINMMTSNFQTPTTDEGFDEIWYT